MQKSSRQKKLANKPQILSPGDAKRIAQLLPNI
jgi:ribosomal protein L35